MMELSVEQLSVLVGLLRAEEARVTEHHWTLHGAEEHGAGSKLVKKLVPLINLRRKLDDASTRLSR